MSHIPEEEAKQIVSDIRKQSQTAIPVIINMSPKDRSSLSLKADRLICDTDQTVNSIRNQIITTNPIMSINICVGKSIVKLSTSISELYSKHNVHGILYIEVVQNAAFG